MSKIKEKKLNSIKSEMEEIKKFIVSNNELDSSEQKQTDYFNNDKETSKMTFDILNGCNENEVMFVQKNAKKQGFFEKFFNLFD